MALDLGSSCTRIHLPQQGVVLVEPSLVAWHDWDKKVIAVGHKAWELLGRTPQQIKLIRPLAGGMVADPEMAKAMISHFFQRIQQEWKVRKPHVLISGPSDINPLSRKAIRKTAMAVGAGGAKLISQPVAAAIGAGLIPGQGPARILINLGSGTTEICLVAQGELLLSQLLRPGSDALTEALISHIQERYQGQVGEVSAEKCKATIGSAAPSPNLPAAMDLTIKSMDSGIPQQKEIAAEPLRQALIEPLQQLVQTINQILEGLEQEMQDELKTSGGLLLCGGGALLHGLPTFLSQQCGLPCGCAQDPLFTTINGCALAVENRASYRRLFLS